MKKIITIVAIFAALSVLVSMMAVSSAMAVDPAKTGPTPKQAPTQKTPPAQQFSKDKVTANKVAVHTKFWDIYIINCTIYTTVVNSHFSPCGDDNPVYSTPIGDLVCKCSYGIKTPPVNEITELDVKTWGTGSKGAFTGSLLRQGTYIQVKKDGDIYLPQFTSADVKQWKKSGPGRSPKVFGAPLIEFTLKPTQEYIGLNTFTFSASTSSEYDAKNNLCFAEIIFY